MSSNHEQISSIILCGGSARRLGGVQKPLLAIDGVPLVERIASAVGDLGPVLISANSEPDAYSQYGEVIADTKPDQGPLAGIAACLQHTCADLILVVPGDAPDYSGQLAELLLATLRNADADITAVCAHDGRLQQYLHLALRPQAGESLQAYLADGGRSVRGWLASEEVIICDASRHAEAFLDIDSPEDLRARQSSADSSRDNHSRNR